MPDENSTTAWTTQTSTNQTWNDNDFVLDFWSVENEEDSKVDEFESVEVEDESKSESAENEGESFSDSDLFGESDLWENENINNSEDWNKDEGTDEFMLGENSDSEVSGGQDNVVAENEDFQLFDDENHSEWESWEQNDADNQDIFAEDNDINKEVDEGQETVKMEDDFWLSFDEDNAGSESEEKTEQTAELFTEDMAESNHEEENVNDELNVADDNNIFAWETEESGEDSVQQTMEETRDEELTLNNEWNVFEENDFFVEEKKWEEININNDNEGFDKEVNSVEEVDTNETFWNSDLFADDSSEEEGQAPIQDFDFVDSWEMQPMEQPNINELGWDMSMDEMDNQVQEQGSFESQEENNTVSNVDFWSFEDDSNIGEESVAEVSEPENLNLESNVNIESEETENGENNFDGVEPAANVEVEPVNTVEPVNVNDSQNSVLADDSNNVAEPVMDENQNSAELVNENVSSQENASIQSEIWNDITNDNSQNLTETSQEVSADTQKIWPSFSLDQILGIELDKNPQFADNSTAISNNNVQVNKPINNKKFAWIVMWIGLFVLAWFVIVLAFPSKNTDRKGGDVVQVEEEHYVSWNSWDYVDTVVDEPEEPEVQDNQDENSGNIAGSSVVAISEDDGDSWWDIEDIQPYICAGDGCGNETELDENTSEEIVEDLDFEDVSPVVSDFSTQGENYYMVWDDMQDKKLMKYATQLIVLCENYQSEIENWEWLDPESFDEFKAQAESLLSKISNYMEWSEEVDIFVPSEISNIE